MHTADQYTSLRIEVIESIDGLKEAIASLMVELRRSNKCWVWKKPEGRVSFLSPQAEWPKSAQQHAWVAKVLGALEFERAKEEERTDGRRVIVCPGVYMVNEEGIELAHAVNKAKARLVKALKATEGIKVVTTNQHRETVERTLRMDALIRAKCPRFHYMQATRSLVVEERAIRHVGFTWAKSRLFSRVSKAEVSKLLSRRRNNGGSHASLTEDERNLATVPADEMLVLVRDEPATPMANLAWEDGDRTVRVMKPAVLPIILLGESLPTIRKLPMAPMPAELRTKRCDVEVESTPYLGSIGVYRYLERFREERSRESRPESRRRTVSASAHRTL